MIRKSLLAPACLCVAIGSSTRVFAAEPARQVLQPVAIQHVTIDDSFWSPKLKVWRDVTLNDCFDKFEAEGTLRNFDHVARGEFSAQHGGQPWYDGLLYEMIRAAGDFLAEQPDPKLEARIDGYIDRISAAADHDPDGYINTYTQMREPTHRWGENGGNDLWQHDLYNAGCLVDAAVRYYRATGKTKLLETAIRLSNLMCREMGPAPKHNVIPGHSVGEEALNGLYQLLKEQPDLKTKLHTPVNADDYLALAQFWIDSRGHHEGRKDFGAYDQDDIPVMQQTAIEGHAVRAALMCTGMSALGMTTGRADYAQEAQRLWENMIGRRMYITGGVGSEANQERFGDDYSLPNNGYLETCAAVANGFLDRNINLASGDAIAVDELERTLYNGVLSGVSLKGTSYFYENPLEAGRNRVRWQWHSCPCCPPMFLKIMSALPGYIYATDAQSGLYVNLFVGSKAKIDLAGNSVGVVQSTDYPWAGDVKLAIDPTTPIDFDLHIRVPGWNRGGESSGGLYSTPATGADADTVSVNGQAVSHLRIEHGYARIHRKWQASDVVEIHMAMPPQRVKANEHIGADRGRVALMRGPIVYCLESVDNDGSVRDLFLPDDAAITAEKRAHLLDGVTVLHSRAHRLQSGGASDEPADITAIPYYANANRGPVSMTTWIPTDASRAIAPTIAALATPTASHCNPSDSLFAMSEGRDPKNSSDRSRSRFTWWDHRGTSEWVQYDLDRARKVSSVEVYWWDDARIKGQCRAPQSWRLLYKTTDGQWQLVPGHPEFGTKLDDFNSVHFDPVETTALKIEVQLQPGFSGGILQWRVLP